jgi:hypothetical protein
MVPRLAPEDGDVVVRQQRLEETLVYVLHTAPGVGQYVLRSREEAVAHAVTFAKRESVRALLTAEADEFALLEDFRDGESV